MNNIKQYFSLYMIEQSSSYKHHSMKISIEGPSDLGDDLKDLIIDCWKSKKI
jgi:hypothetical protein